MKNISDGLAIGFDFTEGDVATAVVGRHKNGVMDVINIFTDQEARDIYDKLTTKKEEEPKNEQ